MSLAPAAPRTMRRSTLILTAILAASLLPALAPAQTTDTWLGGTGNWSNAADWSSGVPTSTSNVFIGNGPSAVTIDTEIASCDNLTIYSGNSLTMPSGVFLDVYGSTINNAGTLALNATTAAPLYLNIEGNVTLKGAGSVTMSNSANNYIFGYGQPSPGASLTNESTIEGAGNFSYEGSLGTGNSITNQGTINANQSTPLVIGVGSGTFTNAGTLEATNGGTLGLFSGTITNTEGTIHADPGSTVQLQQGMTIVGGMLTTSGTGLIQANCCGNNGDTLNGVTLNGTFQLNNGEIGDLEGTITDNGSLQLNATTAPVDLDILGAVVLTGKGTLEMSNSANNYIFGYGQPSPGASLSNEITIEGAGNFGWENNLGTGNSITNQGTISANQSTPLVIGVGEGTFNNTGTLKVKAGSAMYVTGGGFTNFSASMSTLTGGKYLVSGTLEFDGANIATNAANITLTGAKSQIVNQSGANGLANFAVNAKNSTLSLMSGKSLSVSGNVSNAGTLTVETASAFQTGASPNGSYTQTAGSTKVDGTLIAPTGVSIEAGALWGAGKIVSTVQSSGSVTPGNSTTETGILSTNGTYTQNAKGSLNVSIGGLTLGSQYDQLAVTNGASLNGTLNIKLIDGFVPAVGDTFTILTASAVSGKFATVSGLTINSAEHFTITYNPTNVTLTVDSGS
jgi:hypothetical protein